MIIELRKFGTTLTSREDGREAFAAIQPVLKGLHDTEKIEFNFAGVNTFSPSWADEFITSFVQAYGNRIIVGRSENLSVQATLSLLEQVNNVHFNRG